MHKIHSRPHGLDRKHYNDRGEGHPRESHTGHCILLVAILNYISYVHRPRSRLNKPFEFLIFGEVEGTLWCRILYGRYAFGHHGQGRAY